MNQLVEANLGSVGGRIQIRIVGEDGKIRYDGEVFDNLLTNFGLDTVVGNNATWIATAAYCGVGTSSTAPSFTDTTLGAQVGGRTNNLFGTTTDVNSGSPNYIHAITRTFAFAQGAITGNIAEVGFFTSATGSNCVSHALVKDGLGNPTTLTVLVTDTLYITYELRHVPNIVDTTGTHTISAVGYPFTQRCRAPQAILSCLNQAFNATVTAFESNSIPALGVAPTGSNDTGTSSGGSYSNGTFYRDYTFTFTPTQAVFATGIGTISFGYGPNTAYNGFYTIYSTTKIPKLNTQTLTVVMRVSQARI